VAPENELARLAVDDLGRVVIVCRSASRRGITLVSNASVAWEPNTMCGDSEGAIVGVAFDLKCQIVMYLYPPARNLRATMWWSAGSTRRWTERGLLNSHPVDPRLQPSVVTRFDAEGASHCVYRRTDTGEFQYVTTPRDLKLKPGDRVAVTGRAIAAALDAKGGLHAVCLEEGALWYEAVGRDPADRRRILEGAGDGCEASIDVDREGCPHVAARASRAGPLVYASVGSDGWTIRSVLDEKGGIGKPVLHAGKDGTVAVCYLTAEPRELWFAWREKEAWKTCRLVESPAMGHAFDFGLDAKGFAHVCTYNLTNQQVEYATNSAE